MNDIFIDSSAWIEYFMGSEKGRKVREHIHKEGIKIFTTGIVVAEVCTKFLKDGLSAAEAMVAIRSLARTINFDAQLGFQTAVAYVAERKKKPKLGLIDAHIIAVAAHLDSKVLTCDYDFSGISNVILIK
ncbi:MAG TPA: PIN domain-containing protein [Candidatus Nanoarchaeia archaeon]|nr:PIN domain-containing protein [Candidatus Nanoarchaeia archaeon]